MWLLLLDLSPGLVIFALVDVIALPVGEAFIASAAAMRTKVGEEEVGQQEEEEKEGGEEEEEGV